MEKKDKREIRGDTKTDTNKDKSKITKKVMKTENLIKKDDGEEMKKGRKGNTYNKK